MIQSERQSHILREIDLRGSVSITEFAERIGASGMTVRRDLAHLEEQGLVERVHGGAVKPRSQSSAGRRLQPLATIGMIVPSARYYFPDVIRGAKVASQEAGARLVLGISEYSSDLEREQIARLTAKGIDGLLVTPSTSYDLDPSTFELLDELTAPAIVVERAIDATRTRVSLNAVRSDHAHGAELAVNHLLSRGRRRIALAWRQSPTAPLVREGYRRALEAGTGVEPIELELTVADAPAERLRERLIELLDICIAQEVDAVVVLPDEAAISLIEVAEDRGLMVPTDLAIVAYDDEVACLASVPLTAVAPPKYDVGYLAAKTCLDRILAENRGLPPSALARVGLLPTLIERESSQPAS
ncbi:LacI family DNA-binding transcriptional regulator [Microbacterium sulfonylureivorans]|uniref:LacI family DNA-binding transcriptional regulator n=1 Tax=Microbacterium sulfonylureivorans TaxID=2486854 RepID=UPI000FD6D58D|nr:LacI family DNA-binding transcriptional regulator [Microbacterium sulfonylureivorans]